MYKLVILVVAATLVQDIHSCCCVSREPWMTQTCLECLYGLFPGYSPVPPQCGCFKDIKNPLASSLVRPSCGNSILYYPEVEYPVTNFNVCPYYYNSCYGY